MPSNWTLIGAQMVMLHAWANGVAPTRTTGDLDVLVNVRALAGATARFSRQLLDLGFELDTVTPDGRAHRFSRGDVRIDVVAPDNVGRRADLTTVPPGRTIEVPGGSQALRRTEHVEVRLGDEVGNLPRPSLLGAILLKARAVDANPEPERHLSDLAFLLSLAGDPHRLLEQVDGRERRYLRARRMLLDPNHAAWRSVPDPERGLIALSMLTEGG